MSTKRPTDRRPKIAVDRLAQGLRSVFEERANQPAAGIINEDVDPAPAIQRHLDRSRGTFFATQVLCDPINVRRAGGASPRPHLRQALGVDICECKRCAVRCEAFSQCDTETPCGPGDDGDLRN
jgi:hypothetical protein